VNGLVLVIFDLKEKCMEKRRLASSMLLLLAIGVVVYAGGNADASKGSAPASAASDGTPQYGGTLTLRVGWVQIGTDSFDALDGPGAAVTMWANPYKEFLAVGDIDKYGPRGNNAYSFMFQEFVPEEYLTGMLAKSWEWKDPKTLVFYVRDDEGVMWYGNERIGMKPRPFTTDDVYFSLDRYVKSIRGGNRVPFVDSVERGPGNQVIIRSNSYWADWSYLLAYGWCTPIYCPEEVQAGASDWRNTTGTGPFKLESYVPGNAATFVKNPDWWGKVTINGKTYDDAPFIDKLIYPIIADESTAIAATRTGKIDINMVVPLMYEQTLKQSAPELVTKRFLGGTNLRLSLQNKNPILKNKNVRRALMIGTDLKGVAQALYGDGEIHTYPLITPGVYTPLDQLPSSQAELFKYDPDKAKKMLADAGYPNGFNLEFIVTNNITEQDLGAIIVDQWKKIGVNVSVRVLEPAAKDALRLNHQYKDMLIESTLTVNPVRALGLHVTGEMINPADYSDLWVDEQYKLGAVTIDPMKRNEIFKAVSLKILDDVPYLPTAAPYRAMAYWPWIKNYYGEIEATYYQYIPQVVRLWIDQNQKKSMGY
jgi:peptide/nickel transport system substrate-binding protein